MNISIPLSDVLYNRGFEHFKVLAFSSVAMRHQISMRKQSPLKWVRRINWKC